MKINIAHAAEYAAGGLLATAVLHKGMAHLDKVPESIRPPEPKEDPGEFIVNQAESMIGKRLPQPAHQVLAQAAHLGFGTVWPTLFGLFRGRSQSLQTKDVLRTGAMLGAGVWAIGYIGALPASGLIKPLHKQGPSHIASALASHIVWGIAVMLPVVAIEKARSIRRDRHRVAT
jgi:hypothetical protein